MAENKGFDLAALLGGVSKLDTGGETITRLPLERIDPDPDNFYSLVDLDELAANIETVGLLDPIRVRPNGERYMIVSGHRRRAACQMIADGGSDMFASGVPCIVEYGEASDAMRRLRLIYANSATRQLTSAEQSRQAEEVTRLLYELKEQGVEFPGRMRDHVAEACKITKSKLARLAAIRHNLHPALLVYYDGGEMVEDVAYKLSRFPEDLQGAISDKLADGKRRKMPTGQVLDAVLNKLPEYQKPLSCRAHAGGPDCHHKDVKALRSVFCQYSWDVCDSGVCCMDCYKRKQGCSDACQEAKARTKLERDVNAEKEARRQQEEQREADAMARKIVRRAKALLPYVDAAKLGDREKLFDYIESATAGQVRKWATGDTEGKRFYSVDCLTPYFTSYAGPMAKRLGCSLEMALGLPESEKPTVSGSAAGATADDSLRPSATSLSEGGERAPWPTAWQTGEPEKEGWYAVRGYWYEVKTQERLVMYYRGGKWYEDSKCRRVITDTTVTHWFPLPEEKEE